MESAGMIYPLKSFSVARHRIVVQGDNMKPKGSMWLRQTSLVLALLPCSAVAQTYSASLSPVWLQAQKMPVTGMSGQPMDCTDCKVHENDAALWDQSVPASLQTQPK